MSGVWAAQASLFSQVQNVAKEITGEPLLSESSDVVNRRLKRRLNQQDFRESQLLQEGGIGLFLGSVPRF